VVARVVSLEEAPVGELPSTLDRALHSHIRDSFSGTGNAGEKVGEAPLEDKSL
jgi:hypothetical protein